VRGTTTDLHSLRPLPGTAIEGFEQQRRQLMHAAQCGLYGLDARPEAGGGESLA